MAQTDEVGILLPDSEPEGCRVAHDGGDQLSAGRKSRKSKKTSSERKNCMSLPGPKNGRAKMTEDQARLAIFLLDQYSIGDVAKKLGVSYGSIWQINRGNNWRYLRT